MRNTATALITGACVLACAACASQPPNPTVGASTTTYPIGAVNGRTFDSVARGRTAARAWMAHDAAAKGGLLYVANLGTNAVDIFKKKGENQQPVGTITTGINFPGGMTVDDKGNLYVVNERLSGSQYSIPMYAKGATAPSKVFSTDLSSPTDVAVAHDGTIYITNFNELSNGWISVYPKGNPKKEYRLTGFDGGAPLSVALDKAGNVYAMYDTNDTGGSGVSEFASGAKTGTDLGLIVSWGGGIQVDPSGNIVVVQQLQPPEILEFAPGETKASKTFQLPDQDQSFDFALNSKGNQMFADDQTVNSLLDIKLPNGKVLRTVAGGFEEPTGVALSPPEF